MFRTTADKVNFFAQLVLLVAVVIWCVHTRTQLREIQDRLDRLDHRIQQLEQQQVVVDKKLDTIERWQQRQDAKTSCWCSSRVEHLFCNEDVGGSIPFTSSGSQDPSVGQTPGSEPGMWALGLLYGLPRESRTNRTLSENSTSRCGPMVRRLVPNEDLAGSIPATCTGRQAPLRPRPRRGVIT